LCVFCAENGVDGLQFTRSWLARSADHIKTRQSSAESAAGVEPEAASSSSEPSTSSTSPATANATLNAAFLELLDWDDDRVFPEVKK